MTDGKLNRRELLALGSAAGVALHSLDAFAKDEVPQVPRRTLGKTGVSVPILLFGGAVKLDRRFDPKLAEALRYGVNYIDAADCYSGGACEPAVGNFHTRINGRKKLFITSKSDKHYPDDMAKRLDEGLAKMKTSYVDMYYLHALTNADRLSKAMEQKVAELKKAGKMKFFGFSCHDGNVAELLTRASELPWIDSVMFRYNFRQYGDKELNKAMDAAYKSKVGLIAMKTQGSEASFSDAWKKFEGTGKWTKHQAVLKGVWADERIAAAVSHMSSLEMLRQNIAAAVDRAELGALDTEALEKYAQSTRKLACDGCDHICNPHVDAPVQIGTTMRYLMYHDVYGEPDKARALFEALPTGARKLAGVDFGPANAACPHDVDVVAHMKRAADLFRA